MARAQYLVFVMVAIVIFIMVYGLAAPKEFTVPSDMKTTPMPGFMTPVLVVLGFPVDWLYFPAFIYFGLVPLLGVWLILYGFLDQLRIFKQEYINGALSFLIAFSTIPLGVFVSMVAVMFGVLGVYATVMFVFLAIAGIWFMSSTLWGGWRAGALEARLFNEQERELIDRRRGYEKRIKDLEAEMGDWRKKAEKGEVRWEKARQAIGKLGMMVRDLKRKEKETEQTKKDIEKEKVTYKEDEEGFTGE